MDKRLKAYTTAHKKWAGSLTGEANIDKDMIATVEKKISTARVLDAEFDMVKVVKETDEDGPLTAAAQARRVVAEVKAKGTNKENLHSSLWAEVKRLGK